MDIFCLPASSVHFHKAFRGPRAHPDQSASHPGGVDHGPHRAALVDGGAVHDCRLAGVKALDQDVLDASLEPVPLARTVEDQRHVPEALTRPRNPYREQVAYTTAERRRLRPKPLQQFGRE